MDIGRIGDLGHVGGDHAVVGKGGAQRIQDLEVFLLQRRPFRGAGRSHGCDHFGIRVRALGDRRGERAQRRAGVGQQAHIGPVIARQRAGIEIDADQLSPDGKPGRPMIGFGKLSAHRDHQIGLAQKFLRGALA